MEVLTFARSASRPMVSNERADNELVRACAVGFHHQAGAAAGDMCDDRRTPVQLGHRTQVDRECEHDLLTLAKAKIRRLDENAGGTEIDRLAQLSATTWNGDIDNGTGTVPRMKAAFHGLSLAFV
jgi:hypothetical protein